MAEQERLSKLDFEEQTKTGLDLIENLNSDWINKYNESGVEPVKQSGKIAFYVTDLYPFEKGMMDGFEIMAQYIPSKKRICISVMNENPDLVRKFDQIIRDRIPIFKDSKKVGYLFASNEGGEDTVFSEEEAEKVYNELVNIFGGTE